MCSSVLLKACRSVESRSLTGNDAFRSSHIVKDASREALSWLLDLLGRVRPNDRPERRGRDGAEESTNDRDRN